MRHVRANVLTLLCATILFQASAAQGQTIDPSFRSDIHKLLEITGSAQMGVQVASIMTSQMLEVLKTSDPAIPDRALELAKQVLDAEFAKAFNGPDSMVEELVSVYAKHFTNEDVRGLLTFYSSDLGRKVVVSMPAVVQQSATVGQQWALKQAPRIMTILETRLRAEGFIK
jgi:hypothetical protein